MCNGIPQAIKIDGFNKCMKKVINRDMYNA